MPTLAQTHGGDSPEGYGLGVGPVVALMFPLLCPLLLLLLLLRRPLEGQQPLGGSLPCCSCL